jgi:hypothetical protein
MTSYLRKYVTALASARDYVAQWSSDHVYADEELIVPFPTLAIFDPDKHVWTVHIKAWIYLPLQAKSLTSLLPSLPRLFTSHKNNATKNEENSEKSMNSKDEHNDDEKKKTIFNETENNTNVKTPSTDDVKVDQDKKEAAAAASKENHEAKKNDGESDAASDSDDDIYEEMLRKNFSFVFWIEINEKLFM